METFREFIQKYWFYLLVGFVTVFLAALSLLTVIKLRQVQPIAPTVPQKKPEAASQPEDKAALPSKCKLAFSLASSTESAKLVQSTPKVSPTEVAAIAFGGSENIPPQCTGLSASPTEGTAPLTVKFTGSGADSDGKVFSFEFSFGDGGEQTIEKNPLTSKGVETQDVSHTYTKAGSYTASLRVKDNNNAISIVPETCKVTITVGGSLGEGALETPEATETAIPLPEIPESGALLPTILTLLGGGVIILLGILL